jgi:hypothetical protein
VEPRRFDRLIRTLSMAGSRRRLLGALLTGVLVSPRLRSVSAKATRRAARDGARAAVLVQAALELRPRPDLLFATLPK